MPRRRFVAQRPSDNENLSVNQILAGLSEPNRKAIRLFARRGGPDLGAIRGHGNLNEYIHRERRRSRSRSQDDRPRRRKHRRRDRSESSSTSETTSFDGIGPYHSQFAHALTVAQIYPHGYTFPDGESPPKPTNWDAIQQRLARTRAFACLERMLDEFTTFFNANTKTSRETQTMTDVLAFILGLHNKPATSHDGIPFRLLAPITEEWTKPGNPDLYYGAHPEQLHVEVRRQLAKYVVPTTWPRLPILPNCMLSIKGCGGSASGVRRQALYEGALGERAFRRIAELPRVAYSAEGEAHTLTMTLCDGELKIYTVHSMERGGRDAYVQHLVAAHSMTEGIDGFLQGCDALRNAFELTKEERNRALRAANATVEVDNSTESSRVSGGADEYEEELRQQLLAGEGIEWSY